jgi:hypothetical protein
LNNKAFISAEQLRLYIISEGHKQQLKNVPSYESKKAFFKSAHICLWRLSYCNNISGKINSSGEMEQFKTVA